MTLFKKSNKEKKLNLFLEKINKGEKLSEKEMDFLNNYKNKEIFNEKQLISPLKVYLNIKKLVINKINVICNLKNNYGEAYELPIINTKEKNDNFFLILNNNNIIKLKDNYLYNIKYNINNFTYYLEKDSEYNEKLPIQNDI